jgi:hypothetical protein|eukprot:COSAG02_NODE_3107_length_7352_cov_61.084930_4_plen_36_part_00
MPSIVIVQLYAIHGLVHQGVLIFDTDDKCIQVAHF